VLCKPLVTDQQVNQEQHPGRWTVRDQILVAVSIMLGLLIVVIVICGYAFGWEWSGLPKRTFWDWRKLLIVPVVLAIGGYLFTRSENRGTQQIEEQSAQETALQAPALTVGTLGYGATAMLAERRAKWKARKEAAPVLDFINALQQLQREAAPVLALRFEQRSLTLSTWEERLQLER
jgi:hypothetical protein